MVVRKAEWWLGPTTTDQCRQLGTLLRTCAASLLMTSDNIPEFISFS